MSVIMVTSKSVTAQTIESMGGPPAPDQLQVGADPEGIAVNPVTNKIYILNPSDVTVTVLYSKSGTVKNIPVGLGHGSCPYCIGVDTANNKIYVANTGSDSVSVIDGNSDTLIKNIQVGATPTFVLASAENEKIYVLNTGNDTVSVIDGNNNTVERTIPVGEWPTFMLDYSEHGRGLFHTLHRVGPCTDTTVRHFSPPGFT